MIELRATVAGIFFSKPARSGAATACVALGVGIVGSYVLGVGLSAMHAVAGLDHQQVGALSDIPEELIYGTPQPSISVLVGGERLAFYWRTTWWHDYTEVIRYSEAELKEFGDSAFPWPCDLERRVQALRASPAVNVVGPLRSDLRTWADSAMDLRRELPFWAAHPAPGSNEFDMCSWGYGWPFRSNARWLTLHRDAGTGVEPPPDWVTTTDVVIGSLALDPIIPGLLGDAAFWSASVWCAWWMLATGVRRWLLRGGRCAYCAYFAGVGDVRATSRCPECGRLSPVSAALAALPAPCSPTSR
jgi:hypothetical protein